MLRKLISHLNVQTNKKKYEKPLKSISWSDTETFSLDWKGTRISTLIFGLKQNII